MSMKFQVSRPKYHMSDSVKYRQWEDQETLESKKGRARIYPTLRDALSHSDYGDIVTTARSNDIYVITKGTWGKKSGNKIVKSFGPESPWSEIVAYAKRTIAKHGEDKDGLRAEEDSGGEGEMGKDQENQDSGGNGSISTPERQ